MKVLVTGGGGFVGRRLVGRLRDDGHAVVAALGPGTSAIPGVQTVSLELTHDGSVTAAVADGYDLVFHLAAVSSGGDASRSPGVAWEVNAAGTARLAEALSATSARLIVVSTAEVYGAGEGLRNEDSAVAPRSPYAASKFAAEIAAREVHRRRGMPLVIARPFPHTGAGQDTRFVVPAFAARIRQAMQRGESTVRVGNLEPIRDFLHVDDVVSAYVRLIDVPADGSVYNIASGVGVSIEHVFKQLVLFAGATLRPAVDPALVRPADIPELIGDASRLRAATGWTAQHDLDDALREVMRAQAD